MREFVFIIKVVIGYGFESLLHAVGLPSVTLHRAELVLSCCRTRVK